MSKNAEGWVRHRGGKSPVGNYDQIEYRMRSGQIMKTGTGGMLNWDHGNWPTDIMAYKLHKPAEQVEPFIEAVQAFNALAKVPQLEGPLQWRDRITTIDVEVQARTVERAELVQKLAGEGFALIGRINELLTDAAQKHEDMSDWRNWKVGDLVEYTGENDSQFYIAGVPYAVERIAHDFYYLDDESGGNHKWTHCKEFKWHSRPSA